MIETKENSRTEFKIKLTDDIEETIIGKSPYAAIMNDNAYVGYMYGTPNSNNYADTHANIHDSTIKTMVDKWYEEKIYHPHHLGLRCNCGNHGGLFAGPAHRIG